MLAEILAYPLLSDVRDIANEVNKLNVVNMAPEQVEELYSALDVPVKYTVKSAMSALLAQVDSCKLKLELADAELRARIAYCSAIEQLSQCAADFERRAFARLFLNKSLLSPTSNGWLCNNGLARESEFALISESQPLPGEYQPRQNSLFRPFDSSSQPNASAH